MKKHDCLKIQKNENKLTELLNNLKQVCYNEKNKKNHVAICNENHSVEKHI